MKKYLNICSRELPINPNKPIRALSLDGGGIYGLTTAILLRQLCEQDEEFLSKNQISLFSGTSAGAVNALLLAQEESPREAVLNGCLESFWQDQRVYASHINQKNYYDPMSWTKEYNSNLGIGSWFASEPFRELLSERFGNKTLKDLPNKVMVATFNLYGKKNVEGHRQWIPKLYYNFPFLEEDNNKSIVDIAYGAGTPPGARDICGGIVDGGLFVPNPAVNTIAKILEQSRHYLLINITVDIAIINLTGKEIYHRAKECKLNVLPYGKALIKGINELLKRSHVKVSLRKLLMIIVGAEELKNLENNSKICHLLENFIKKMITPEVYYHFESENLANAIKNTRLLSVGVGEKKPAYWLENFSLGIKQFGQYPTNPPNSNWWTPETFLALDAPSENSEYVCSQTLGGFYHRLNPPLFGAPDSLPTLPATFLAKNQYIKEQVIEQIKTKTTSDAAHRAVQCALTYLKRCKEINQQSSKGDLQKQITTATKTRDEITDQKDQDNNELRIAQLNLYIAQLELKIAQIDQQDKKELSEKMNVKLK